MSMSSPKRCCRCTITGSNRKRSNVQSGKHNIAMLRDHPSIYQEFETVIVTNTLFHMMCSQMNLSKAREKSWTHLLTKGSIPGLSITISGDVATATHAIVGKILLAKHDIITISGFESPYSDLNRDWTVVGTPTLLGFSFDVSNLHGAYSGIIPGTARSPGNFRMDTTLAATQIKIVMEGTRIRRPQVPMLVPAPSKFTSSSFLGHLQVMILDIIHRPI